MNGRARSIPFLSNGRLAIMGVRAHGFCVLFPVAASVWQFCMAGRYSRAVVATAWHIHRNMNRPATERTRAPGHFKSAAEIGALSLIRL